MAAPARGTASTSLSSPSTWISRILILMTGQIVPERAAAAQHGYDAEGSGGPQASRTPASPRKRRTQLRGTFLRFCSIIAVIAGDEPAR